MQNTLPFLLPETSDQVLHPGFNVVIAYEDLDTGKQAKRVYDYLTRHVSQEFEFSNQMWKFEVLGKTKLREMAAKDAAAADLIIISAHGRNGLPSEVRSWIEMWLKLETQAIALVALLNSPDVPDADHIRDYLTNVARRGKMEFFSQPGQGRNLQQVPTQNHGRHRDRNQTFSIISGIMDQDVGPSHWGINE